MPNHYLWHCYSAEGGGAGAADAPQPTTASDAAVFVELLCAARSLGLAPSADGDALALHRGGDARAVVGGVLVGDENDSEEDDADDDGALLKANAE